MSIYKLIGETPLQAITWLKLTHPELAEETISYAGRLDPMAEGILLLLIGDENKRRKEFEHLDKTYVFEILFGIETDSYDALGIIAKTSPVPENLEKQLEDYTKSYTGTVIQTYPPYSSKPVNGKPLYWWARNHKLSEIELPTKDVQIHSFSILKVRQESRETLQETIISRIKTVSGDFRQEEILKSWKDFFTQTSVPSFTLATCEISCSSGTYIRSIVQDIGKTLGYGALAYSIKRTRVGEYV